jgi:hypothetical protein
VAPILVWFAVPYPNHIRDFVNLVVNRPVGTPTAADGLLAYADAIRHQYFHDDLALTAVALVSLVAAVGYRRQTTFVRLLIVAVPLQLAMVTLHHTRFPRFLFLTVVLLYLLAALEIGRWVRGRRAWRVAAGCAAPLLLAAGLAGAGSVVTEPRFEALAFGQYTENDALSRALREIRGGTRPDDRIAVMGESDALSPALIRWELGLPEGARRPPMGSDVAQATLILLMVPDDPERSPDAIIARHAEHLAALGPALEAGEFTRVSTFAIPELYVTLNLYRRSAARTGQVRPASNVNSRVYFTVSAVERAPSTRRPCSATTHRSCPSETFQRKRSWPMAGTPDDRWRSRSRNAFVENAVRIPTMTRSIDEGG